ncbi:MAG: phosphoglycerate kinase [Planctomycetia bacterium]|nr:phosphoglycerate kinase [Planctomycetia bacterium]
MPITTKAMAAWCRGLLGADPSAATLSLEQYLAAVPRLESLADMPRGTPVLVRGDVDAKPGEKVGDGDIRLRSMRETLEFGRQRGWIQVIFGHIGRKPEGSLDKVAKRIGDILGCQVTLVKDWLDPATNTVTDAAAEAVKSAAPGDVIVLENARKYPIEQVLWKAKPADCDKLAPSLAKLANEMAEKIAKVYVSEAFSAGNLDASTCVIPATMDRVALGDYVAEQFDGPLMDCLKTRLVIFSGLKIDKLDNLEAMIGRGTIRQVIAAGSVATALKKAAARLDRGDFDLGMSEDPANAAEPYYIPPERIEQAKKLIADARAEGVEFTMPVDFVLGDGSISDVIGPGNQQFDVGPKSSEAYAKAVARFIASAKKGPKPAVAFHNGVFGMFEDPRFEAGTKKFIPELKRMTDADIKVYIGGGEGGTALERYGKEDWVTGCFTAGGTVLKALGGKDVPYLVALAMAAEKTGSSPHK